MQWHFHFLILSVGTTSLLQLMLHIYVDITPALSHLGGMKSQTPFSLGMSCAPEMAFRLPYATHRSNPHRVQNRHQVRAKQEMIPILLRFL
jgi:hypothetical protein